MPANPLISPDAIRLFMLDRKAEDNFLLDDVDMPSDLLALAMDLTVDQFNTTPPILCEQLTVETFPYRLELLLGVTGMLLRSKAMNLTRNALPYQSTSGTAVDDKSSRAAKYMEMATAFLSEYTDRITKIKQQMNIDSGFGYVGGPLIFR
jgi:hypothetical protein